jgi:hypothetical protein
MEASKKNGRKICGRFYYLFKYYYSPLSFKTKGYSKGSLYPG